MDDKAVGCLKIYLQTADAPSGIGREHRIPLVRIRCMTDKRYKELREIWKGGRASPAAKSPIN